MLDFRLLQIRLRSRFYLLLPKLNSSQVRIIGERLKERDFTVEKDSLLVATKRGTAVHIDPSGFCWSSKDPTDAIAPIIPEILGVPKEAVPLDELQNRYFRLQRFKTSVAVRLSARIESSTLWRELRASGECGLTPDERAVASLLLESSTGGCVMLTDFPTQGSHSRMIGKKQYYESSLDPAEAASTLRVAGPAGIRNSYLPERCVLLLRSIRRPSREKLVELFDSLGEWCYLRPE